MDGLIWLILFFIIVFLIAYFATKLVKDERKKGKLQAVIWLVAGIILLIFWWFER